MSRTFNNKTASPYYPPRERWHGRFYYWGLATRHRLALDRIHLPQETTFGGIILGIFVPGLAVFLRGPRLWGKISLSACAVLFLMFILWLGYPLGNYAFGVLIAIHGSGFAYYCGSILREKVFFARVGWTLALVLVFGLGLYAPLRNFIQHRWVLPLSRNGQVFIVEKSAVAGRIERGDWVMYSLTAHFRGNAHQAGGAVRINEGFGLGPVLAMAGDCVSFGTNAFTVNGVARPLLPHMPQNGSLTVPQNNWFIWPDFGISGHGNANEETISATMLQVATVPESQFIGKPFKRWFWRKQILP